MARDLGQRPAVIKQVFSAFPPGAVAGPGQFRGQAAMGARAARWDLVWGAVGALNLDGERIPLGGLDQPPRVDARPRQLTAAVPAPGTRLELSVITSDDDAVAVAYADPQGGTRAVRHAALARIELSVHRQGNHELTLPSSRAAYEYGSRQGLPGIELQPLPEN